MSFSDFDLSQFYTRRNSNYNIAPEDKGGSQPSPISVKEESNDNDDGATRIVTTSEELKTVHCGFLFSVSKDESGEYWPIKLGNNTIGSSFSDDIVLSQKSVSAQHAVLNAERQNGKLVMKIKGNGNVMLNGLEITTETVCRDRDILTIGDAYQLLLLFVDVDKYGLKKAENFEEESLPINETAEAEALKPEEAPQPEEEGTVFLQ